MDSVKAVSFWGFFLIDVLFNYKSTIKKITRGVIFADCSRGKNRVLERNSEVTELSPCFGVFLKLHS